MNDPEPYDWRPGEVRLKADGSRPTLCFVVDGDGVWCGAFRVGKTSLQYNPAPQAQPPGAWQDATLLWPRFPPWVRRQVTDALQLTAVF